MFSGLFDSADNPVGNYRSMTLGCWYSNGNSHDGSLYTHQYLNKKKRKVEICKDYLKTLDTIGNRQRPVCSLGVSQHMHKITNL